MCGQAGFFADKPPVDWHRRLSLLLLANQTRGHHATGVYFWNEKDEERLEVAPLPAEEFIKTKAFENLRHFGPTVCLAHTRFATQGDPLQNGNNHPLMFGQWVLTHNGHIGNDKVLRRRYALPDLPEVDSFAIIGGLQSKTRNKISPQKAVDDIQKELVGSYVCLAFHRPTGQLFKFANRPSYYQKKEGGAVWWASESWMLSYDPKRKKKYFPGITKRVFDEQLKFL